jgi:hypothetical protein
MPVKMVFPEAVKPKIEQGGWLALVSVQDVLRRCEEH